MGERRRRKRQHKVSSDRLACVGAVNRTLSEIEYRLSEGGEAAQSRNDAASKQADALFARQTKMNSGEVLVFDLLRKDYALSATDVGRQPLQAELDELFDAEIEMQLAA